MHINDDPFASIKLLDRGLQDIGYTSEHFTVEDRLYYRFQSPSGGVWFTRGAVVTYPFTHSGIVNLSVRKDKAYELLSRFGIKVPATYAFGRAEVTQERIDAILARHSKVIVKPADASLSRGLALNLQDTRQVMAAVENAIDESDKAHLALVQEQVEGEELRFVVVNGKAEAVILRQKPRVIGDGVSTVKALIAAENTARSGIKVPYLSYPQLDERIIEPVFLSDTRVPGTGEAVELGKGTMVRTGASIYNVADDVHPSYSALAESVAQYIGASFIVLDILLSDHTAPKTEENYSFIEFNTAPELKLFYSCRDGKHFDAVGRLVPMIDKAVTGLALVSQR